MEQKRIKTPEGQEATMLVGEQGESHDCKLEKGLCNCANIIEVD